MRTSEATTSALTLSVTFALLAGCSGSNGSQITPTSLGSPIPSVQGQAAQYTLRSILPRHSGIASHNRVMLRSFMTPGDAGRPLVFVADGVSNVNIYLQRGKNKMVGQITGLNGAFGLATDTARNLYVATYDPDVLVYAPPYTQAPTLLNDPGYGPNGVSISRLGVVGVANFCNYPSCANGTGSVTFFAKKSPTPCVTVSDATNFATVTGDAFDDKGILYITGLNSSGSTTVGEISGGCSAKKITLLTTTNSITGFGDVQINKADGIAVLNAGSGSSDRQIDTYARPKSGSLGSPVSITPLTSSFAPVVFAFVASGADLYTAEEGPSSHGFSNKYDYPAGGVAENAFAVGGIPQGVAVTPPLVP
jgi:hypothetical protein